MDSERFQVIVLEHLAHITQEITELRADVGTQKIDISALKTDMSDLKTDVASLKTDVSTLKTDVASLKTDYSTLRASLEAVKEQTAHLTEFKIETANKFEKLMDYMDYFKVHLVEVDTELLRLKKKIS